MLSTHRICVLGREIQVRSTASAEHVRGVEAFVNEKIGEAAQGVRNGDSLSVAILTLMNVAELYCTLVETGEHPDLAGEERLARLVERCDAVLREL